MINSTQPNHVQDKAAFLTQQYLRFINSSGIGGTTLLSSIINQALDAYSANALTCARSDFDLIAKYTINDIPKLSGIYLKLLHGRTPIDFQLDDWGDDGPWIGPLKWFHCTYLATFGLGFSGGEEYLAPPSSTRIPAPIFIFKDMIYYDGVYYGDWEIQTFP